MQKMWLKSIRERQPEGENLLMKEYDREELIFISHLRNLRSCISHGAGNSGPSDMIADSATEKKDAQVHSDGLFLTQSIEEWPQIYSMNMSSVFFVIMTFLGLLEASTKDVPGSTASATINITSGVMYMTLTFGAVSTIIPHLTFFFLSAMHWI